MARINILDEGERFRIPIPSILIIGGLNAPGKLEFRHSNCRGKNEMRRSPDTSNEQMMK